MTAEQARTESGFDGSLADIDTYFTPENFEAMFPGEPVDPAEIEAMADAIRREMMSR